MNRPATLGELKRTEYRARSVRDELRQNLIDRLRRQETIFPGIVGYDDTVLPQIVNAILSKHDILFLGLRGQAKTRILRSLPSLMDEYRPVVGDLDLFDDPIAPRFSMTRRVIHERGDDTPIRWIHREERFHEKLATPDVTIADLIGEIDLVKHAEGRYLSDEEVMHFGLIPRSNLGIFAINELPDLAPRIQVGLFNVLEERDVQIRGFPIRLPLDVMLVFSANPEDYTNRGRIVTPLKDRLGSVIRTHYPRSIEESMQITKENAWLERDSGAPHVEIPRFMSEIVEEFVRLARTSSHVNQQSGVSVRASITCMETLVSNAERRGILLDESRVMPRVGDLQNVHASCRGKLELMLAEDDLAEEKLITALLGEAVKNVGSNYFELDDLEPVIEKFQGGKVNVEIGDEVAAAAMINTAAAFAPLLDHAGRICEEAGLDAEDPPALASATEFILEALYVNNRLSKYSYRRGTFYKR